MAKTTKVEFISLIVPVSYDELISELTNTKDKILKLGGENIRVFLSNSEADGRGIRILYEDDIDVSDILLGDVIRSATYDLEKGNIRVTTDELVELIKERF